MKPVPVAPAVRINLSCRVSLKTPIALGISLALCGAEVSLAQQAGDAAAAETELEEVTVTGSRITSAVGMATPTPVTALGADELETMSPVSITEAMLQLPQFFASQTAENFGGVANGFFQSPGGGNLNLRGIGGNRTLTLLDGRRMPPASAFGGPDINTFPSQMMRRIETVTGGASAAYGTDAVSGVINYILDTSFEGIRGSAQYGVSEEGDGQNATYSFGFGHALTDRMHLLVSAGHSTQDGIYNYGDRNWYQSCGLITNPAPGAGTSQENPLNIPACDLRSRQWSVDGVLNPAGTGALGRITFDAAGNPVAWDPGTLSSNAVQVGGSGADLADELFVILPRSRRTNAYLYTDYDVTDQFNVYVQGLYSEQLLERKGTVTGLIGQYGPFGQSMTIYNTNPFLPANVRALIPAAGVTFNRVGSFDDISMAGQVRNDSEMYAATLGFKHNVASDGFFSDWHIDGYAQLGETKLDAAQVGGARADRIFQAVDAVVDPADGQIKCRVTVVSGNMPDCVPLNLFGRGQASPEAIDWVTGFEPGLSVTTLPYIGAEQSDKPYSYISDGAKHRLITLEQTTAEITASGKVADGWAGPISAAVGGTYRKEKLRQFVQAAQGNPAADPNVYPSWCNDTQVTAAVVPTYCQLQIADGIRPPGAIGVRGVPATGVSNVTAETQFSAVPNMQGDYDVKELFMETIVPVVQGLPALQAMTFQGAARWADYGGSGSVWSWKVGLDAQFTSEVRLRGTFSQDTRAANMAERFDATGGSGVVMDRKVPGPGEPPVLTGNQTVNTFRYGNPAVSPESGDTLTAGVVYRPRWLPGFDVSVDWLKVKLDGAIALFTPQDVVDSCYLSLVQEDCDRIDRYIDVNGNDAISIVNQNYRNLTKASFEGVDFELGYARAITLFGGAERLSVRFLGGYLIEASTTTAAGLRTDNTGSLPLQNYERKANLIFGYTRGPFSWNLNGRYNSGGFLVSTWNVEDEDGNVATWNVSDNDKGGSVYWDTRFTYGFQIGGGNVDVFANVQNLFDRDPPLILSVANSVGQVGGGYDQLGRRYVMGFNVRF